MSIKTMKRNSPTSHEEPESRRLSPYDQAFLGFQQGAPSVALDKGTLLFVDGRPPSDQEWRAHVAGQMARQPALRERLATNRRGEPVWSTIPMNDADIDYHAAVWPEPTGSDPRRSGPQVIDEIAASTRLDLSRPPWRVFLVRRGGGNADGFMIHYRCSHIQQDGAAMHSALWMLFGEDSEPVSIGRLRARPQVRPRDLLAEANRARHNPLGRNDLTIWGGRPTGPNRHHLAGTTLTTLRRAGRRHGVTINDIFLTALAGAVRAWAPRDWDLAAHPLLHTAMPLSVRPPDQARTLSNYSSVVWVPLPVGEPDRHLRLQHVSNHTRVLRDTEPALLERTVVARLPASLVRQIATTSTRLGDPKKAKYPISVSNPRGMSGPLAVCGRRITGLAHFPLRGQGPLSVVLGGLDEQVSVAFTVAESVSNADLLPGLFLHELHHLT
ncbi:WS/DGAT domain-containing protein [Frankia sp. Ag45/Mut15]|uniref:WS/DGAT domain-containing protein n=1 Tax=Frankia umida TaxID=573489 RepID=A0ABT0JZ37_9ACTN|nr:WS/DGAT domain-containing protein [Frankia umida]MCK9876771.1 WS/DGAT domain-containing protein [Frankia umida]